MNILLSAAGRRPYLVRWFRDALRELGIEGRIVVADNDRYAPSQSLADVFVFAPRVDDEHYRDWLRTVLEQHSIELAVSLNDFELSEWSRLPRSAQFGPLVRLPRETQLLVEDKFEMSKALVEFGVRSPETWLASAAIPVQGERFVTKGRFGSASRGLRFVDSRDGLSFAVDSALGEATDRSGVRASEQDAYAPKDLLVVQEEIKGEEFGLDIVSNLDGQFAGVLARRKISMRSGETDRAVSVDPEPFEEIAKGVAAAIPHPGTFDIDVIVDGQGMPYVIDINPRFGGGYPFSHVAGSRVPHAYVAWKAGREIEESWLRSAPGVYAGKVVDILPAEAIEET